MDVIFVTSPKLVANSGVIDTCISDHLPVHVPLKLKADKAVPTYITTRSYNKYDSNSIATDLISNLDSFVSIFRKDKFDKKLTTFDEIFLSKMDFLRAVRYPTKAELVKAHRKHVLKEVQQHRNNTGSL